MNRSVASLVHRVAVIVLLLLGSAVMTAHDRKTAGAITLVIGWASEPAYSGSLNGVIVTLTDGKAPLAKADGQLSAEVSFGNERITLPLQQAAGRPHEFHATLVPTRAGTYAFRITGTINRQPIDISTTCSDATFHCVEDASSIQFPVKDPTIGQLAERLDRALPRVLDESSAATSQARTLSWMALIVSAGSVIVGVAALVLAKRNGK